MTAILNYGSRTFADDIHVFELEVVTVSLSLLMVIGRTAVEE